MARRNPPKTALNLENLESRQVLSAGVAPTGEAQYMLELVNAVRSRPGAAAEILASRISKSTQNNLDFYGVDLGNATRSIAQSKPIQPLAWNDALATAATSHSRDMATKGFQSHQGSDGAWGDERVDRAGYGRRVRTAENAYAYSDSVDQAVQAFAYDWGVADRGHFRNLTDSAAPDGETFKEVGFGIVDSNVSGFGKVVTQDFGLRADSPTYLLGVAFDDANGDHFYNPGEGRGGVEIDVTDSQGRTQKTTSADPGGYQLALAPGRYRLAARLNGREIRGQDVNVGDQNVKVDFDLSQPWTPAPVVAATPKPQVQAPTQVTAQPKPQPKPVVAPQVTVPAARPRPVAVAPTVVSTPTPKPDPAPIASAPATPEPAGREYTLFDQAASEGLSWNVWKIDPTS